LIDFKIRKYIIDVRSYRGVTSISDHFLVKAIVRIRISVAKREAKMLKKQFNIKELKKPEKTKDYREGLIQNK